MARTSKEYLDLIQMQLGDFNWTAVSITCADLVEELFTSEISFEVDDFYALMKALRKKRRFAIMVHLGDALSVTSRINFSIRNLYGQALIEQGYFTSAISVLERLETDIVSSESGITSAEYPETQGILGRAYKQLYIRTAYSQTETAIGFLKKGIMYYLNVYRSEPSKRTWHGINAVALLSMAKRHRIDLSELGNETDLATEILVCLDEKRQAEKADAWDFATAAECCVELGDFTEALKWLAGYASQDDCDAFELASTLRQFEEIWELKMSELSGQLLLPILRAELLKRSGGQFEMDPDDIRKELAVAQQVKGQYEDIVEDGTALKLEKVFGRDSFKTYKWYMEGAARCLAVARIGLDNSLGAGTGFLVRGSDIHASLGEELLLLTNSHVISTDLMEKAISPHEAVVIFEVLDSKAEFSLKEVVWSSPSTALDCALVRFSDADQLKLRELTSEVKWYPLSQALPLGNDQKVYIIGHPQGGTLQLSFQDNQLLDTEDPKIHYRTPTDNGSSGSPIFTRTWDLLGLHHAGSDEMKCLNSKGGTYPANEGIWICAIILAIGSALDTPGV